jgi:GNAT superfamily N-acetyltransferase
MSVTYWTDHTATIHPLFDNVLLPDETKTTNSPKWKLSPAQPSDFSEIKTLFCKLHAYNASLDPRFALSNEWETYFDTCLEESLAGHKTLCLLAKETATGRPCGFIIAAVHQDSGMWKYRDWVEVEALYLEQDWQGQGLAEDLLEQVYAWAAGRSHEIVQLYVTASNARAIRFYEREGFRPTQHIMRKVLY